MNAPVPVRVWVDPGCPWAWEVAIWLRDLRDRGLIDIEWKLFSLELNSSEPDTQFWDACARYGESFVALALARRHGAQAFETLYVALGTLLHEEDAKVSPELVRKAAADAGMHDLVDHAVADPDLAREITGEYRAARDLSVFGVPTLQVNGAKVIYGPILPLAPRNEEALEWWEHVRWVAERPDFFEMKRWPRDLRPGQGP